MPLTCSESKLRQSCKHEMLNNYQIGQRKVNKETFPLQTAHETLD